MIQTVLIADRDPRIRECCRRYLQAHGYDAGAAGDGLQCVEQLQSLSPDVLVLDPEILWGGGVGVLAWLREQAPLKTVRVILTDGHFLEKFPPDMQPLIVSRLERPNGLYDLTEFINELQQHLTPHWLWDGHASDKSLSTTEAVLWSRP